MTRYFFNIRGASDVFDGEGKECSTFREVHAQMLVVAVAIIGDGSTEGDWQVEVLNEAGSIVRTMDLGVTPKKVSWQTSI